MATRQQQFLLVLCAGLCLLLTPVAVEGACCTLGQPLYSGDTVDVGYLLACSDGPCSGPGYDYTAKTSTVQSNNPNSCCDRTNYPNDLDGYHYNPPAGSGLYWAAPVTNVSSGRQIAYLLPGTSPSCDATKPVWRCGFGGTERTTCINTVTGANPAVPYSCPVGTVNSGSSSSILNNANCCLPTCKDISVTETGLQAYPCAAPLVANLTSESRTLSDATCCLPTCGDTNTSAPLNQQFSCPDGYKFDMEESSNTDISLATCCTFIPSCNKPFANSTDTYACPGLLVYDTAAAAEIDVSVANCCKPTCGDSDDTKENDQKYECPANYAYKTGVDTLSPPSDDACCGFVPSCNKPLASSTATYQCPGLLVYDLAAANASAPLTDALCCKQTCGDANATAPGNQTYQCPPGYTYDMSKGSSTNVTRDGCCIAVPATCSDTQPATIGLQAYSCPAPLVADASAGSASPPSNSNCCLAVCADTNATAPGNQTYQCPSGYTYDMSKGSSTNVTRDGCCIAVPATCSDTQPATSGLQAYSCPAPLVADASAGSASPPSNSNCCLAVCADTNATAPGNQTYQCPPGYTYDMSEDRNPDVSQDTCCNYVPTCSKPSQAANSTATYQCSPSSTYVYNPAAENSTTLSVDSCCLVKYCYDVDPLLAGNQTFECPGDTVYNPATAGVSPPDALICCKPAEAPVIATCNDIDPITANDQAFRCPSGWVYDPSADSSTNITTASCCKQRTCIDTEPLIEGNQMYKCSKGTWFDNTKKYDPIGPKCCCKYKPPCAGKTKTCPSSSLVNSILHAGMMVTGSGPTYTVTYSNNAFVNADCTEGLSWVTLATCNTAASLTDCPKCREKKKCTKVAKSGARIASAGTPCDAGDDNSVMCQKEDNVMLGTNITLDGVACNAVINIIVHDGSFKKAEGNQAARMINLLGCKANTKLPSSCRSNDGAGACGGSYAYTLVCPKSGNRHLRRMHFF